MTKLIVENLEDEVQCKLQELASEKGQTTEDFVRDVLRSVASKKQPAEAPMGTRMKEVFSEVGLTDDEVFPELRGQTVRSPEFDE